MAQQPLVDQGLLIIEVLRSHSETPQLIVLLWTRDQPDADTSTWKHTTPTRDRHPCPGLIRTNNPADPRLRSRGHWDQEENICGCLNYLCYPFFCGASPELGPVTPYSEVSRFNTNKYQTNIRALSGFWARDLSNLAASDPSFPFDRTAAVNPCVIWFTVGNWSTSYQPEPHVIIDSILMTDAFLRVRR